MTIITQKAFETNVKNSDRKIQQKGAVFSHISSIFVFNKMKIWSRNLVNFGYDTRAARHLDSEFDFETAFLPEGVMHNLY